MQICIKKIKIIQISNKMAATLPFRIAKIYLTFLGQIFKPIEKSLSTDVQTSIEKCRSSNFNENSMKMGTRRTGARLTKLWLLTISLNSIEMNRRLLVNNDFILHSLLGKLTISLITRP